MAPSHAIREQINAIVRERLIRDGVVHGPAMKSERLVSRGYTHAEKSLAANYAPGDVVAFHRPYKRLGVEKGDELRVSGVDHEDRTVRLESKDGRSVLWEPGRLAARSGGVEVYRVEQMELRRGDRIRWTRNDLESGLVNSQTAEVTSVKSGRVTFGLEDGRTLGMVPGDPPVALRRPRLGLDRTRLPGPDGRHRHRRHGGWPPQPHQPEDALRGDQPGPGPGGTRDRRCKGLAGAARGRDRGAYRGPRSARRG